MEIIIKKNIIKRLKSIVDDLSPYKTVVITNTTLKKLWLNKILNQISAIPIVIPDGEEFKSLEMAQQTWKNLIESGFTRKSLVIGLGGGVVTDLAAFVASTFMRGTYLGLIPTTLLAQVDAAIGGKTGINFEGKNIIGTFYLPNFVLIDPETLKTLPEVEMLNGFGEVVKYGILDSGVYKKLNSFREIDEELIRECVNVKLRIVEEDLRESGKRRILNLGHTIGHAIEKASNYRIKHGFAVAIGLMANALIAEKINGFDSGKVEELLDKFSLPKRHKFEPKELLKIMKVDKKAWYGELVFILPEDIGKVVIRKVDEKVVLAVLEAMRNDSRGN
ncbi:MULTISPECIES: 3-dehydroquinate synthase [Thermococcus]|uniref:3-dehydroquinate synthase n=1 Tax=Thermococcus sibiricus TaxID=172049 RepID=A0A101EM82_9EURY|nr:MULTISPECIES: 3-dehydroquinate synthase [Thermococcus]KUK17947.1 MAG: 3-dehydroquinate synthase [Thermococcus sibiricus]KUK29312.1 MAG: 3-dehydroquinate synthase [Thermococcus sp. 40_45]MBC7094616.1 3-dehydroquinate synthase [Thermococcus sp.]HII67906.1 3-dehydroquinate synthase [Thermococcaceae archaeon]